MAFSVISKHILGLVLTEHQGKILAVWILAAKLPNSDLTLAVDFLWIFLFFQLKRPPKNLEKYPPLNSPGKSFRKIPFSRGLFKAG